MPAAIKPLPVVLLILVFSLLLLFLSSLHLTSKDTQTQGIVRSSGPERRHHDSSNGSQVVVLVTGAAGFIGFHVSVALVTQWRATVVGVDIFSPYYDVQLKKDRASELVKAGARVYRGDVCDKTFLQFLFAKYNFSSVVHLAAQAGVRHSMDAPHHYLHNNINCFLTLLEVIKGHQGVSLVFASSSTVYGHHSPFPFSPPSTLLVPSSIYAATKMSNEHFAEVFCTQHGLRAVGVRFFTTYGPWGRPDMAVYSFAEGLYEGHPLRVYNSTTPPATPTRDFTFVSDAVRGVLLALEHVPSDCGQVFNVGSGTSVELTQVLRLLERELNATAKIEYGELPPFDLSSTLADISASRRVLGFSPRVGVEEGVREFVRWFRSYKLLRSRKQEAQRNKILEGVLVRGEKEVEESRRKKVEQRNADYRTRIQSLKQRYKEFADKMKIELPSDISHKEFVYYEGVDSPGSTIIKALGYRGNIELMKKRCEETEQCLAFNTNGEFKNQLKSRQQWVRTSESEGLYVADLDPCSADLHSCGQHQHCINTGPSSHNCVCPDGFSLLASGCVPRYVEGEVSAKEREMRECDYFDGLEWEKMTSGKKFVFFQGLDSPGGDYLVVGRGERDVESLSRLCRATHHCLGFNTNGILKSSLHPPHKWTMWTSAPNAGLYVLDVDYCGLGEEACAPHSSCQRLSAGNYSCVCDPPWTLTSRSTCEMSGDVRKGNSDDVVVRGVAEGAESEARRRRGEEVELIHVIVSSDADDFAGLVALLSSLAGNSSPQSLRVHLVLAGTSETALHQYLCCHAPSLPLLNLDLQVVELDPRRLEGRIHVYSSEQEVGKLSSLANFARFFFHEMFPGLEKALYLDVDTVVAGDVAELWRSLQSSQQLLLAVPRESPTYGDFFSSKVQQLFFARYGRNFDPKEQTFNAGVYGVNLDLWRKRRIHEEVLYWLDQQSREPLWRFGTQPVMLLIAHRQWTHLDPLWNVNGLGWNERLDRKGLAGAKLLHWSGKRKPWLTDGLYRDLWSAYAPVPCSGHGNCTTSPGGGSYMCQCEGNYTGAQCHIKTL